MGFPLSQEACAHSQEMLDEGYFEHESYNRETVEARLERSGYAPEGYSYGAYGENIAWGTGHKGLPDDRFEEWMGSPDHRQHILDEGFREIGICMRVGETYKLGTMYTADFGTRV